MKFIATLYFTFFSILCISAQDETTVSPDLLFQQANQFFQEGKFKQALQNYKAIDKAGKTSCDLHYNLGNTYFRLDSLGKAILHYEKALKINPSHTKTQENIEFANDFITQKAGVWPQIFYKKWFVNIIGKLGAFVWWLLATILIWLALFLGKKYLEAKEQKIQKRNFYMALVAISFSLIFIIFGIARLMWQANDDYAIVTTELLQLKNGPSEKSKDILKISEGNKLQIIETTADGWCKIQLPDGQNAWLNEKDLERI